MRSINPALFLAKTKKVSVTRSFVASTAVDPIDLELPGYYLDIVVKFLLNVTGGSTVSPATDWHAAVIKNLEIEASNAKPYLEHDDGRYLRYENWLRSHGAVNIPDLPDADEEDLDVKWQIHIHPGDNFLDPFDISDVIATRGLSNLVFKLTWGAASDLGTGYTINSGTVELIINYVVLQPNISEQRAFPGMTALPGRVAVPSFWQPQWRIVKFRNINTTYANLGFEENFLNGFFLKEVLMLVKDVDGDLVNNVVTEVQITNKEGFEYFDKDFTDILDDNMRDYELTSALTGVVLLDLRDIFQKTKAGLYLANAQDLKWHFTIDNVDTDTGAEVVLVYRTHYRTTSRADVIGKTPAEFAV